MSEFAVGDIVRCIHMHNSFNKYLIGKLFEVTEIVDEERISVRALSVEIVTDHLVEFRPLGIPFMKARFEKL